MTNSAQISKSSPKRPRKPRIPKPTAEETLAAIRLAAALPPGHLPAADPRTDLSFIQVFADLLAAEAHEFYRQGRFSAASQNLEYEEQFEHLSNLYENIDTPTRQYLAHYALHCQPVYALFTGDTHRAFRRTLQAHQAIRLASRLGS